MAALLAPRVRNAVLKLELGHGRPPCCRTIYDFDGELGQLDADALGEGLPVLYAAALLI